MAHERYRDADVLALIGKCSIELPDEFADIAPAVRSCRITATLKDGSTVVAEFRRSLQDDISDPGWTQAVEKTCGLLRERLGLETRNHLVSTVSRLEAVRNLRALVATTRLPS
jgi:hypothetical protein